MRLYEDYEEARTGARSEGNWFVMANYPEEQGYRNSLRALNPDEPIYLGVPDTRMGLSIDEAKSLAEELLRQVEFFTVLNAIIEQEGR